jgi:pimeloyl-ACP methyl ester carboxylesterase
LRVGIQLVAPASPQLVARWVEPLFFRVPSHPRPAWEVALLERAEASFDVRIARNSLRVWTWGAGPVVLLVHGWAGRGSQLGAFVAPLVDAGFRVAVFDGPGHGDATERSCTIPDLADAIAAVARSLGGLHAVVAHSMGAASTVLATSRGLDVDRIALIAPPANPIRFADEFARKLHLDAEVVSALHSRVESRLKVPFSALDVPSLARGLRQELLVVHDEGDRDVSIADGRAISSNAPRARLITTRGLGHRKILRDPTTIQNIVSFVRKEARSPRRPGVSAIEQVSPLENTPALLAGLI